MTRLIWAAKSPHGLHIIAVPGRHTEYQTVAAANWAVQTEERAS